MCWALLVVQMIKNLPAIQFDPWVRKVPWRRKWQPIPLLLPRESHEQRNLVGYSSQDHRVGHNWVINTFISGQWYMTAGSQREKSCPWQRSWGRKPDKMQRRDLASGVPPGFSWTSTPQNQSQPALLYCAFHSSDILWKKLTRGFSLLHMKGMFQLKPLWWLSNLPDRFPRTFYNLWIAYSPPTTRGTKLKAS